MKYNTPILTQCSSGFTMPVTERIVFIIFAMSFFQLSSFSLDVRFFTEAIKRKEKKQGVIKKSLMVNIDIRD